MDKLLMLAQCADGLGMFLLGVAALLFALKQYTREEAKSGR